MLAQEGPYTFAMPMFGSKYDLNLTMTTAPEVKEDSNLVKLFFDGLFGHLVCHAVVHVTGDGCFGVAPTGSEEQT